jgi:hypothetical protein
MFLIPSWSATVTLSLHSLLCQYQGNVLRVDVTIQLFSALAESQSVSQAGRREADPGEWHLQWYLNALTFCVFQVSVP